MRLIRKGPAPRPWAEYQKANPPPARATKEEGKRWAKLHWGTDSKTPAETKAALREALHREQGGLCAYCLRAISTTARAGDRHEKPRRSPMTVEHWLAREDHGARCLEFEHLLGVCDGGAGDGSFEVDPRHLHCDKLRGSQPLDLSPLSAVHMAQISYGTGGEIRVRDVKLDDQATRILGLNTPALVRARAQFLLTAKQETVLLLGGKKRGWDKVDLEKALAHWTRPRPGGDLAFVDTIVRYLLGHHGWKA